MATALGRTRTACWTGAVGLSVLALAARGVDRWSWIVAACAGAVGLLVPVEAKGRSGGAAWWVATATGVGAFVVARSFWSASVPATPWIVLVAMATAVAEELLFRRGMYALLERWGGLFAVASTAVLFGLVHVPVYGWSVLPVDLAAGILFGWQRWATGTWTSSAITHSFANGMQYL